MEHKHKPKIGISIGDLSGIGPEIILKTLAEPKILNYCTPVIYGSANVLLKYRKLTHIEHFAFQQLKPGEAIQHRKINVVNCWDEDLEITPGTPTPESGKGALLALQTAAAALKNGEIDGLVTAPIDKNNIQSPDFQFPGHTEFLTSYFGAADSLMLLASDQLRVATVTGHIPVKDVAEKLMTEGIIRKLTILADSLRNDFGIAKPRIAVLGLNPHAGEKGLLGNEEETIIWPAIKQLKDKGYLIFGPYPADGFFGMRQYNQVDGVLAMYHDQGLIPFKTLAFSDGVNYTAGLSIVRTSPDHGTAYDIAGKNLADESSFRSALFMACDIIKSRQPVSENALKR